MTITSHELVHQGDTMIREGETPVLDIGTTLSEVRAIVNFLRCGCAGVQLVLSENPELIERDVSDFRESLEKLALPDEMFELIHKSGERVILVTRAVRK